MSGITINTEEQGGRASVGSSTARGNAGACHDDEGQGAELNWSGVGVEGGEELDEEGF